MGEPVTLYNKAGETLHVYTASQVKTLIAAGEWYATAADAEAGKRRGEPTPTTAAQLAALEGDAGGGAVEEPVTEDPAPAPARKKAAKS